MAEAEQRDKLWSKALTFLARREHSCQQLRQKLKRYCNHTFEDEALIEEVLAQLIAKDWLSDQRFTQAYIESRTNSGFGPRRIQWELEQRGVSSAIIRLFLSEDSDIWQQLLLALRNKKFSSNKPSNPQQKMKQRQFFYARGFTASQISWVLAQNEGPEID